MRSPLVQPEKETNTNLKVNCLNVFRIFFILTAIMKFDIPQNLTTADKFLPFRSVRFLHSYDDAPGD